MLRTSLLTILLLASSAAAQVTLETEQLQMHIAAAGTFDGLQSKREQAPSVLPAGEEYAWTVARAPIATVARGDATFPASHVARAADRLTVRFEAAGVTATYKIIEKPSYLAFELLAIDGPPIDRINLIQLRIKRLPFLGPWIDVAYDEKFGICLCGATPKTDAALTPSAEYVDMRTTATAEVGLIGATAVLFGCLEPKDRFLDAMEIVERDFRLPAGAAHRRSPIQQYSYLMAPATPQDIDQYIALAKRAGFRVLLYSYTAFTKGAGHFEFNAKYPGGMADLKKVADAVRAAGLKLGLHIHYCKAVKSDAYVTPVPDDRFHKVRSFTLAAAADEKATTLTVNENPAGCTHDNGRRILQIGKELVAYTDYTTAPPYQFTGCERGHLKTTAAEHPAGAPLGLLNVDDWNIFIRFDQNTDIQDEVAERLAQIVADTGPYDMVYFDGAEDIHDPRWYHLANAQYRVYRRFDREPTICETATMSHFSWHMMSRSNAYDVPGDYAKGFTREISCRTAPVRALDFTRIDFGWFQYFGPATPPDNIEYLISRGAGWDCPFSIQMELKKLAAHPRRDDILDMIKTWEDARLAGKITDAHRQMLRTLDPKEYQFVDVWDGRMAPQWIERWKKPTFDDQEHHLFVNERGEYELVPINEVKDLAGGQVRAYLFHRTSVRTPNASERAPAPDETYALIWAAKDDGTLTLPIARDRVTAMRPFGKKLPVERARARSTSEGTSSEPRAQASGPSGTEKCSLELAGRRYLKLRSTNDAQAVELLRGAEFTPSPQRK